MGKESKSIYCPPAEQLDYIKELECFGWELSSATDTKIYVVRKNQHPRHSEMLKYELDYFHKKSALKDAKKKKDSVSKQLTNSLKKGHSVVLLSLLVLGIAGLVFGLFNISDRLGFIIAGSILAVACAVLLLVISNGTTKTANILQKQVQALQDEIADINQEITKICDFSRSEFYSQENT